MVIPAPLSCITFALEAFHFLEARSEDFLVRFEMRHNIYIYSSFGLSVHNKACSVKNMSGIRSLPPTSTSPALSQRETDSALPISHGPTSA